MKLKADEKIAKWAICTVSGMVYDLIYFASEEDGLAYGRMQDQDHPNRFRTDSYGDPLSVTYCGKVVLSLRENAPQWAKDEFAKRKTVP